MEGCPEEENLWGKSGGHEMDDVDERGKEGCWKECKRERMESHLKGYLGEAGRLQNGRRSCRRSQLEVVQ